MEELPKRLKRKYAIAMRRVSLGWWGFTPNCFRSVTLTTRLGDDNTPKKFHKDLRKLVRQYRNKGYELEYCGALELSPKNKLLHWHGLFRLKWGFFLHEDIGRARAQLGSDWNKVHGAFAVKIGYIWNENTYAKYVAKHMLKQYLDEDDFEVNQKMLVSGGWMRKGWKRARDTIINWMSGGHGMFLLTKSHFKVINELLKGWCIGGIFVHQTKTGGYIWIQDRVIVEAVNYDSKGEVTFEEYNY